MTDILSFTHDGLVAEFGRRYGKGAFHATPLFRQVYAENRIAPGELRAFAENPALAARVRGDFVLRLPEVVRVREEAPALKMLLRYDDGAMIESVVLSMTRYATLCVSSQVGCARACSFCETGKLGLERNLTAAEIVAQVLVARHLFGRQVANVVFMGMGEPFDNEAEVYRAIDIMGDQRGLCIPLKSITLSTAGKVRGIRRFNELAATKKGYSSLKLAVSLHAAIGEKRSSIMPINRTDGLPELRAALADVHLRRQRDNLFIEYTLMPGFNDGEEDVDALADFLDGLRACVNLIPRNPGAEEPGSPEDAASDERALLAFFRTLVDRGIYCRIRDSKGSKIMAGCGQLGYELRREAGSSAGFAGRARRGASRDEPGSGSSESLG